MGKECGNIPLELLFPVVVIEERVILSSDEHSCEVECFDGSEATKGIGGDFAGAGVSGIDVRQCAEFDISGEALHQGRQQAPCTVQQEQRPVLVCGGEDSAIESEDEESAGVEGKSFACLVEMQIRPPHEWLQGAFAEAFFRVSQNDIGNHIG